MQKQWDYSLYVLIVYLSLFVAWWALPNRVAYFVFGTLALGLLAWGFVRSSRRGYFVNHVDARLHLLVLADVALETLSFEAFRMFQPLAVAGSFHRNTNFFGCALAFSLVIGLYRHFASPRAGQSKPAGQSMARKLTDQCSSC